MWVCVETGDPYLILTKVPLTFLIFIGRADPVPMKTTSGYFSLCPAVESITIFLQSQKRLFNFKWMIISHIKHHWSSIHSPEENSPESSAASVEQIFLHSSTSSRKFGTSEASFTNSSVLQEGMASLTNETQSQEDTHHCLQKHWRGKQGFFTHLTLMRLYSTWQKQWRKNTDTCKTRLREKKEEERRRKRLSAMVHSRLFSVTRQRSELQSNVG